MDDEKGRDREPRAGADVPGGARGKDVSPGDAKRREDDEERDHARKIQRDRRARVASALFVLVLVVLFVVFIAQNIDETPRIDFLFFHFEVSVIWIFLAVAFLGGVVGYVLGRPSRRLRLHDQKGKK